MLNRKKCGIILSEDFFNFSKPPALNLSRTKTFQRTSEVKIERIMFEADGRDSQELDVLSRVVGRLGVDVAPVGHAALHQDEKETSCRILTCYPVQHGLQCSHEPISRVGLKGWPVKISILKLESKFGLTISPFFQRLPWPRDLFIFIYFLSLLQHHSATVPP